MALVIVRERIWVPWVREKEYDPPTRTDNHFSMTDMDTDKTRRARSGELDRRNPTKARMIRMEKVCGKRDC